MTHLCLVCRLGCRTKTRSVTCTSCMCYDCLLQGLRFSTLLEDLTWTWSRWGSSLGWSSRRLFHLLAWMVLGIFLTHPPSPHPTSGCDCSCALGASFSTAWLCVEQLAPGVLHPLPVVILGGARICVDLHQLIFVDIESILIHIHSYWFV